MTGINKTTKTITATGDQLIDSVISTYAWGGTSVTYAFPTLTSDYSYTEETSNNFTTVSTAQKNAALFAMEKSFGSAANDGFSVEGFTNLDFSAGAASTSTLRFAQSDTPETAYAYYPGTWEKAGDTWFGTGYAGTANDYRTPEAGNYAWHTLIHELGHALGLKHGHETDTFGKTPAQYDSVEYTVMTYNGFIGDTATGYRYEKFGAPQTFMMADIAALQHMYGADYTTNSGNTVYKWTPTSGNTFVDGKVAIDAGGNRIFATIWDGGGRDTFDLTAYKTALQIDLRPGGYSKFSADQLSFLGGGPNDGFARGNIFNALLFQGNTASLIEDVKGGSGNDKITGNQVANVLYGNGGNDILNGDAGNDFLVGGVGADKLNGGTGTDTASYAGATTGVVANLATSTANTNDAKGDIYSSIENLTGSSYADRLSGNAGVNTLSGAAGNDILNGDAGNDMLVGGIGADRLNGGAGIDTASYTRATTGVVANLATSTANTNDAKGDVYSSIENLTGSSYADKLYGDASINILLGDAGDDLLNGAAGNDVLNGDAGNDILVGGIGADRLNGGAGTDTASYAGATKGVTAHLGRPNVNTNDAKGDVYSSIENLTGSSYADSLYGDAKANTLSGSAGNDLLSGAAGNDLLVGGIGADDLYGGGGADRFIFSATNESTLAATGRDSIFDFLASQGDRIDLSRIDANTKIAGDQAFSFINSSAFSGKAGELRYASSASDTYIYGDVNGDGKADFAIHLDDQIAMQKGYFLL
ncbi:M10 family metallopeptidase C-terminal domain-containing protein [Pararhizobium sp.]|uniref:M10 family metallopeptidase C-terminal domain-containing protein n=1 Tax=Pararhizobium sp. TaxID=1977563 RepID=UPI003D136BD6